MFNAVRNADARNTHFQRNQSGTGRLSTIARAAWIVGVLAYALQPQQQAKAATLDNVSVQSAIGQPLRARIALQGQDAFGAECVRANLQSMEGELIEQAEVRISRMGGTPVLLLSTANPIHEPAVNLAVQIVCRPQESREYAVLLDMHAPRDTVALPHLPAKNIIALHPAVSAETPKDIINNSAAPADNPRTSGLVGEGLHLLMSMSLSGVNLPHVAEAAESNPTDESAVAEAAVSVDKKAVHTALMGSFLPVAPDTRPFVDVGVAKWFSVATVGKYWQPALLGCAGLLALLILPFGKDSSRSKKAQRDAAIRRSRKAAHDKAMEPIPYTTPNLPNLHLPAEPEQASKAEPARANVSAARFDERSHDDLLTRSPQYRAEEIEDELQLAQFWMGVGRPERAIDILEIRWAERQPASPLPWQYLLEAYRAIGDLDKYRKLTARYQAAFGRKTAKPAAKPEPHTESAAMPMGAYRLRA